MSVIVLKTANKKTSISKTKIRAAVKNVYAKKGSPSADKDDIKIVILNTKSFPKASSKA